MNILIATFAALVEIIEIVLDLYLWCIVIGAVLSWLVAFNIINTQNRYVQMVGDFLFRITEPALKPIRRLLPPMGGFDLSPLLLILIIMFLRSFLFHLVVG